MEEKYSKIIKKIEESVDKLQKKDFTLYFFVIDTKGVPSGNIQYIYETAKDLTEIGFNCAMLYQQETKTVQDRSIVNGKEVITNKEVSIPFVGVKDWLGDDYNNIKHYSINNDNIGVSAHDFLFIPEIFANVMNQTKDLPCKRVIICQNINFITEFIPLGVSWDNYNIFDVLTTSETQAKDVKEFFPSMRTKVVEPSIPNYFRNNEEPKKLMVSIVAKDQTYVNKIVKQFHWKFPQYRWVTFTDLRGLNREVFANTLRESAFTIWIDDDTYFGYAPIEAIKSGSIVIGKLPDVIPEWIYDDKKENILSNGLWFDNFKDIHKIIAQGIKLWLNDEIPQFIYDDMEETAKKYTPSKKKETLKTVFESYIDERITELTEVKKQFELKNK